MTLSRRVGETTRLSTWPIYSVVAVSKADPRYRHLKNGAPECATYDACAEYVEHNESDDNPERYEIWEVEA
jgi:hypothetical protein